MIAFEGRDFGDIDEDDGGAVVVVLRGGLIDPLEDLDRVWLFGFVVVVSMP